MNRLRAEFFRHDCPHERSALSHWRKRLGDKLELLPAESLRIGHEAGAPGTKDVARATVDTTVQPNATAFPTDVKRAPQSVAAPHAARETQ